ncbi:MAG: FAD-dependent oxidoreductase [Clostridia bacterium]|nr:FAD-dependent oxidoreductase [Clostridia bacterium]
MSNKFVGAATGLLFSGISLSLETDESEVFGIAASEARRAGINPARLRFRVYKKSVDARKKNNIRLVYSVAAYSDEPLKLDAERLSRRGIKVISEDGVVPRIGAEPMQSRPLVVGMGPAGLFAALLLAENGYSPIIIDRGDCIANRCAVNKRFIELGELDSECNIQFGAGGAGTFSDGKLMTRINDSRISYILERFCEFGAPEAIMTSAKPHIGTDILVDVVDRMLSHIEKMGGEVIYRCRLDGIRENKDKTLTALTSRGEIECSALILATGHSARDTYKMLIDSGYAIAPKDFSVGVRVEHLRENIDRALYGDFAGHPALGAAEYHLSDTKGERGVYTFCMCPGGQIVAGASEEGGVVVNGMSNYARDGVNSNSAVAVSVNKKDYGATPEGAIEFQRSIERAAFVVAGSDYRAPVQTLGAFMRGELGAEPSEVLPTYRDGRVSLCRLDTLLPDFVSAGLRRGFVSFDRKLSGFASDSAVLTGVETRTSAPVRILRTEDMTALGHALVYPCGEGAGYAGGITSSAVDGLRTALALMERFAPLR